MWFRAFIVTLVVELPVYLLVARWRTGPGRVAPYWKTALGAVACSAVTHPWLWFVWRSLVHDYTTYVATGEVTAVVAEALIFYFSARPITLRRASAASLLANGASYACGVLLYSLKILH